MVSVPETAQNVSNDDLKRLKIALRASAARLLATKTAFENEEGRELSWDETMTLILGHVEIRSPDATSARTASMLREVEHFLEDNGEQSAADCVRVFRDSLLDVLRGRLQARILNDAILEAE